jgi:hypothetical protein
LHETNSGNVYFELGVAQGIQIPIVIISETPTLPIDLAGQLWIKASVSDRQALTFQIQALLANLNIQKHRRTGLSPTPIKHSASLRKLTSSYVPESRVERDLLEALRASTEIDSITPQPRHGDQEMYIPDFAVWLSSAPKTIENPVVIEVTSESRGPAAVERAVDQVRAFTQAGDAQTGLIIVPGRSQHAPRVASLAPLIFVLGFQEFQNLLTAGKLVETLRRERNRIAHSAG